MPALILLNGSPASGKSTLARLLARDRPLTLVLDIDSIRGSLGLWEKDPKAAGLAARRLAIGMVTTHLHSGFDVIVPQFLGRPDFLVELEATASAAGAEFYEVALISSPEEASKRFAARRTSAVQNHRAAQMLQDTVGATPIVAMYEALLNLSGTRSRTHYVETLPGRINETLQKLRSALAESGYVPNAQEQDAE